MFLLSVNVSEAGRWTRCCSSVVTPVPIFFKYRANCLTLSMAPARR
jgi:hypothetical protein